MIAKVHVPDPADSGYDLTLDDDGHWSSADFPEVADSFNALHADTFTEWNGPIGVWQAHDVASKLHGEIVYLSS